MGASDAVPQHGARARGPKPGPGGQFTGMLLLMAVPWMIFVIVILTFSFAYHHYQILVICSVIGWATLSFIFIVLDLRERMGGQWFMFLGMMCIIATINSTLAGLYNYHTHMFHYWSYDESRAYTNVLPSEPSAAHQDAGKIVFANSARVDTSRALGYKSTATYCVAPILDDSQTGHVEYWAAGIDCCPSRGDFMCDDAWNPDAKSAVVLLDSDGLVASNREYFLKAVKMAKSSFQLTGPTEPLLLRWVMDPQLIQDDCWRGGVGFLVAVIFIYLLFSIISGAMLHMWSKRAATTANAAMAAQQAQVQGGIGP